jgi:SAM-dependent methyltransferase
MPRADVDRPGAAHGEPWYAHSFGRDYLDLYRHRDWREAAEGVALAHDLLALGPGAVVLDLCCGAGRHLHRLATRDVTPIGLDLSPDLLREARHESPPARLVRGDMRRLPFADAVFDAVLSFFTSFGYFLEDEENLAVLREVSRVLRPGGGFLLDFFNRDHVLRHGTGDTREVRGGAVIRQSRRVDRERDTIEKTVTIVPETRPGEARSYRESVRLYSPDRLAALTAAVGLTEVARRGTLGGAPFATTSPRFILVSRKTAI